MILRKLWKLRHLTEEQIDALIAHKEEIPLPIEGEEKAVFTPEMTEEEFEQYEREQSGWQKFIDKIRSK